MAMPASLTTPGRRPGDHPEDRGCLYAPRCATCPYARCIKELAPKQRGEFIEAWRVVLRYVAPPDGVIE